METAKLSTNCVIRLTGALKTFHQSDFSHLLGFILELYFSDFINWYQMGLDQRSNSIGKQIR